MAWHILLTTPGAEFKVRDELHRKGVWALVPVEFRLSKGRTARALKRPVLPGYCFAAIEDWRVIQRVDGLRSRPVMLMEGAPAALTQKQIDALQVLSRPLAALRSPGKRLRPGDRIRIKFGAFNELSALVDTISTKGKAVALVDIFGRPTPVVLNRNEYEAA